METTKTISVFIIEDDDELRQLLEIVIGKTGGFNVLATYSNCEESLNLMIESKPDVVLMDIDLPGMSGIEGVRYAKDKLPNTDFIMLTILDDDESVFESLKSGASGYILKDTPPAKLLDAISEVYKGGAPVSRSIARKITQSFQLNKNKILSDREMEILNDLCEGMVYKDIGEKHFISGHTVRSHIKNIYQKLHVHTRGEAVQKAIKDRLI